LYRSLADIHNRGALDITEFTIAMHLIQSFMSNLISTVPATLPTELYTAASVAPTPGHVRRTDSVSSAGSARALPPQVPPKIQNSPVRMNFTEANQVGLDGWDVTPQDKQTFDNLFKRIDSGSKGYIDGILYKD
jgi:epidermal growth factor receptor substrate 15